MLGFALEHIAWTGLKSVLYMNFHQNKSSLPKLHQLRFINIYYFLKFLYTVLLTLHTSHIFLTAIFPAKERWLCLNYRKVAFL